MFFMVLHECKTIEDLTNWGIEYMMKKGFTPAKIETEDQFMKFFGVRFRTEDLNNEAKQRQNKDGYVKVAGYKINPMLPYDLCAYKVDMAKYIQEYKEKYEECTEVVEFDEGLIKKKAPIIPAGFKSIQVV